MGGSVLFSSRNATAASYSALLVPGHVDKPGVFLVHVRGGVGHCGCLPGGEDYAPDSGVEDDGVTRLDLSRLLREHDAPLEQRAVCLPVVLNAILRSPHNL